MTPTTPLRILVTDCQELAGLAAARSLGRAGHHVTALSPMEQAAPPAARSRYVRRTLRCPDPWTQQHRFRAWLLDLLRRGEFDAVLPISEAALLAAAALRRGAAPTPTPSGEPLLWLLPGDEPSLAAALSKYQATRRVQELGLPVPPTLYVHDGQPGSPFDAPSPEALRALRYPLVIKTDNFLTAAGRYRKGRTHAVSRPVEVEAVLAECRQAGGAVIIQERIPGRGAGAFFLREDGVTLLRFAHQRLHEVPYDGGASSLRRSSHDDQLLGLGERVLAGLRYQGLAMVEFRVGDDGVPYFLEINGRLWGSLALALHAGVDFPLEQLEAARRRAAGLRRLPSAPPPYPEGVLCRNVLPGELHHLSSLLRSPLPPRRKLHAAADFLGLFFDPRVRHDYLWRDDPLPALQQLARVSGELIGGVPARLRRLQERGALRQLPPPPPQLTEWRRVLFLCYGNICRSPFAAAYLNGRLRALGRQSPSCTSAGFFPEACRRTPARLVVLCRDLEVDLAPHRSAVVSATDIALADAILVMDGHNLQMLRAQFPAALPKTYALGSFLEEQGGEPVELVDPYPLPLPQAHLSYLRLVQALEGLLRRLCPAQPAAQSVPLERLA